MKLTFKQADMWFILAASKGDKDAVENVSFLAKIMSPERTAEAQKLAREWKPVVKPQ